MRLPQSRWRLPAPSWRSSTTGSATGFSDDDLVDGLAAVQALKGAVAALETRLLAEADTRDLARKQLHWGSTADWFTHLAGLTRREGRRAVVHAQQLVAELPDDPRSRAPRPDLRRPGRR